MFSEELEKIDWEETTKAIYSKTESDVLRALGKEHCDVDDFMALISPAAAIYNKLLHQLLCVLRFPYQQSDGTYHPHPRTDGR